LSEVEARNVVRERFETILQSGFFLEQEVASVEIFEKGTLCGTEAPEQG
jgi:hypothetical protein